MAALPDDTPGEHAGTSETEGGPNLTSCDDQTTTTTTTSCERSDKDPRNHPEENGEVKQREEATCDIDSGVSSASVENTAAESSMGTQDRQTLQDDVTAGDSDTDKTSGGAIPKRHLNVGAEEGRNMAPPRTPKPAVDAAKHIDALVTSTPIDASVPKCKSQPNFGATSPVNVQPSRAERPHSLSQTSNYSIVGVEHSENRTNDPIPSTSHGISMHVHSEETHQGTVVHHGNVQVPIVGYEVMEERAKFTIYKVQVQRSKDESWFIFRRYTDFFRLNERLKEIFPHFRLALPPKRWFGNNFDTGFLEDRMLGLQAFLNNIVGHRDVCNSEPVREFFCFDEPPGPHDSLEESRALCELLEEQVYGMKREIGEKDTKIALLEEELALHKVEIENLRRSLRIERALNSRSLRRASPSSQSSQRSESSLPEHDQASYPEADQTQVEAKNYISSSRVLPADGAPQVQEVCNITKETNDVTKETKDIIEDKDITKETKDITKETKIKLPLETSTKPEARRAEAAL